MGALGRACLYASFALGVSVTGVMAASDAAIPGDLLYPLKRGIETVRLDVLPEQYRDELAAYALSERIGELGQLVEAGEMARASAFADSVHDAYEQAVAESDDAGALAQRIDRAGRAARGRHERPPGAGSGRHRERDGGRAGADAGRVGARRLRVRRWAGILHRPGQRLRPRTWFRPGRGARPARAGPAALRMTIRRRRRRRSPTARRGRTARRSRTARPRPEPTPSDDASGAPTPSPKVKGNSQSATSLRRGHRTDRGDGIRRRDGGEPPSRLCQGAG